MNLDQFFLWFWFRKLFQILLFFILCIFRLWLFLRLRVLFFLYFFFSLFLTDFIFLNFPVAYESASSIHFIKLIVVSSKFCKQNLIFLCWVRVLQYIFHFCVAHTFLDHFPEDRIVQVINVAINLSPAKIVLEAFLVGINNNPAVKSRYLFQLERKVVRPVKNIRRAKSGHYAGENFICPARK